MKTIGTLEMEQLSGGALNKKFWHGVACSVSAFTTASAFYALSFPPLAGTLLGIGFVSMTACAMTSPKYD